MPHLLNDPVLASRLANHNLHAITLDYNGSGDSGWIETINPELPGELADAVRNYGYRLLSEHFGGWEINEGSCGQIDLAVINGNQIEFRVDHKWYEIHTREDGTTSAEFPEDYDSFPDQSTPIYEDGDEELITDSQP
jgi:hypothetical protein